MNFEGKRVAFVVSHPVHLLTVVGMVLRYRPRVLFLTEAISGPGRGQGDLVAQGLRMLGLETAPNSLNLDESESYRQALAQNFVFHIKMKRMILDWLTAARPDVVFGDAFEMTNFQHDVGRACLDAALAVYRSFGNTIENCEFPLSHRSSEPHSTLTYGTFADKAGEQFKLTSDELQTKMQIINWAVQIDSFIADVAPRFPDPSVERYKFVPRDRHYATPPAGLARHYDARGREEVAAGRYPAPITFDDHFVPFVRALESAE